mmetsp:Transcript_30588/g.47925  ORF Transcript_30588/g.47925 Transcript_30588/m.47925 type:complete len:672 (-) Transcript_30588:139-2154(-)
MPLSIRYCFYPVMGDAIHGIIGDLIDAMSMACTTFGVCTSLGFGVQTINSGLNRLNSDIKADDETTQIVTIWIITCLATGSVMLGLARGIKNFSLFTFALGCFLLFALMFLDNTWYLLNVYTQSIGHYIQYVILVGFQCDAFEQLNYEFTKGSNLGWDNGNSMTGTGKLIQNVEAATNMEMADPMEYFGSHAMQFQDWWTIFYWGWWISWGPFVGLFIARISRGRTVREVILGSLMAPILYTFLFMGCLGALGIKWQRTAELALGVKPDINRGSIDCEAMGYVGGMPNSTEAIALADIGIYAIACRNHGDRMYDVLEPYGHDIGVFLKIVTLVAVVLYFITSSDSGSYVDDTISAAGMLDPPYIQRIYWAVTEGAVATALLAGGGADALSALQAVSIVGGFPYTFAINIMCTALMRAIKWDQEDEDIISKGKFVSAVTDFTEGFQPYNRHPRYPQAGKAWTSLLIGIVCPAAPLWGTLQKVYGSGAIMHAIGLSFSFYIWIVLHFIVLADGLAPFIGWTFFFGFIVHLAAIRVAVRDCWDIYGWAPEDFLCAMFLYPCVVGQMQHHTDCFPMLRDPETGRLLNEETAAPGKPSPGGSETEGSTPAVTGFYYPMPATQPPAMPPVPVGALPVPPPGWQGGVVQSSAPLVFTGGIPAPGGMPIVPTGLQTGQA